MATQQAAAAAVALLIHKKQKKRSCWVKPWMAKRQEQGAYNTLVTELRLADRASYRNYFRLSPTQFQEILEMVAPAISGQVTQLREPISPQEKLAVTLRFLATGESFQSLQFSHRISKQSMSVFVPLVCSAIYDSLKDEYLKVPQSEADWKSVAEDFYKQWDFPNCIGAMDGKHIHIKMPANSGSLYYNYKKTFSTVLLALVDANYKFLYVDVGCNGRVSDGGVFHHSSLYQCLEEGTLGIPSATELPGTNMPSPYFVVADEAFPLKRYIMKPYAQRGLTQEKRVFNYRLSRARRVVENAFGILSNRFRVFHTAMAVSPETAEKVVLATVVLHNFLRTRVLSELAEADEDTANGPALGMSSLSMQGSNHSSQDARAVRECLCDFVNGVGQVDWQNNYC